MVFSLFNKKSNKNNQAENVRGGRRSRPVSSVVNKAESSEEKSDTKNKIRYSSGAKYGMIIGDEGAILVYAVGGEVKSRNFIAHAGEENLKEFEKILNADKNAPLFLIIDSMDQSFVQQSLPPISSMGVKKLIKKRLDRDLPADAIKGYVLLDRDEAGRRDWNFLMVSLENSRNLKLWLDFVDRLDNRLNGIYLLSVEAENIVKNLDAAIGNLPAKGKRNSKGGAQIKSAKWKLFITNNKVGGVRQVVLKGGKIIFTRLTQPVGEATPAVIAGNIEQEVTGTIEYMKRLSFIPAQGLDVYTVASEDINSVLDSSRINADKFYKFTPFEVAELLGIKGAAQPGDRFGDVVMTSFITCSKAHRLAMFTPAAQRVDKLYSLMKYQKPIASLLILSVLLYAGVIAVDLLGKYSEFDDWEQKKIAQQRRLDSVTAEIAASGVEVKKISDTVFLYKQLISESTDPLSLLTRLYSVVTHSVLIRDISWSTIDTKVGVVALPVGQGGQGKIPETLSLVLRFPELSNTEEKFRVLASKILEDVRKALPEYKVVYTKLPEVISNKKAAEEISFDDKKNDVKIDKSSLEAVLTISTRGASSPAPASATAGVGSIAIDPLLADVLPGGMQQ